MGRLTGKVAVVSGASKGFGVVIATALAREDASVVVNYASDQAGAKKTVDEITNAGGRAIAIRGSVSDAGDVKTIFDAAIQAFDRVDILVNNAGVYHFGPIAEFQEDDYRRQFDTNVLGNLLMTREAVSRFGEGGGSIINIGTAGTTLNLSGTVVYTATKGAVDSITRVMANELGSRKIRVNSVNAGVSLTEGVKAMGMSEETDFVQVLVDRTPLGRRTEPHDIANVVVFLATDEASWLTGQLIQASGGLR